MTPKLLIANRGEIACRIARAAKSLGLPTVAVYSEVDAEAPHVEAADEARLLGPARPLESYLNQEKILDVARDTGATLVHPGFGFLSENAEFAENCAAAGLTFIGPRPEVIRAMGDKERAREIAIAAGVPVIPGADNLPDDEEWLEAEVERVGFPLLIKATRGGGGIGMRRVDDPLDFKDALESTRTVATRAFGDGAVFLERYIPRARHIEIQVFGFGDGRAVHLFERDCSVQRRHQKVIEEAPAVNIPDAVKSEICSVAVKLASACHYDGVGTVEFLLDIDTQAFFFLEMNTRIQVEHPVTEMVTGIDLVAAQIRHAMGEDLSDELAQDKIILRGHAVEARIYAEKPTHNFIPSPGLISELHVPEGEGLRVDIGLRAGVKVTPFYDPMLMKVIAYADTRADAVARLDSALGKLAIEGIQTNREFVRQVLAHPTYQAGQVHTMFVHESLDELISQLKG